MEKYEIILGKDVKRGDIIIYDADKYMIMKAEKGMGAPSYYFGVYVGIQAIRLREFDSSTTPSIQSFWLFEDLPIIKIIED